MPRGYVFVSVLIIVLFINLLTIFAWNSIDIQQKSYRIAKQNIDCEAKKKKWLIELDQSQDAILEHGTIMTFIPDTLEFGQTSGITVLQLKIPTIDQCHFDHELIIKGVRLP